MTLLVALVTADLFEILFGRKMCLQNLVFIGNTSFVCEGSFLLFILGSVLGEG